MNTTVANIILFVFDSNQDIQSLYGYAQDGVSVVRSDDRGLTWSVTDLLEYSNVRIELFNFIICHKKSLFVLKMTAQCTANLKVCRTSESYPLMNGAPNYFQLQSGAVPWTASINGIWTQYSGGVVVFDWFGY